MRFFISKFNEKDEITIRVAGVKYYGVVDENDNIIATTKGSKDSKDFQKIAMLALRDVLNPEPNVVITMEGGIIQDVQKNGNTKVRVFDFDIEGVPEEELDTNKEGQKCIILNF